MIEVTKLGILLEKTTRDFENEGVLNPAVIKVGDDVHVFYRAVSKGNYSSIGYCKLSGPTKVVDRLEVPLLSMEFSYESHGIEDPRITKIDDLYFMTYTAFDGVNAMGALATSADMIHWDKKGIIVPKITYDEFRVLAETKRAINIKYLRYNAHQQNVDKEGEQVYLWDKNVIFFPRRINGKLCFLHRIRPDIQIVVELNKIEELTQEFWHDYFLQMDDCIVLAPKYDHEVSYIGGGATPIETEHGWLLIYHGVHDSIKGYVYCACAALLDLNNPQKEISRLPYPLFKPEAEWELKGEVNNVCFPTGTALFGDKLYIYYGAADERIAVASVCLSDLLKELILNIKKDV